LQVDYCRGAVASRKHLVIEQGATQWVARDLGIATGSRVNGERIIEPRFCVPGTESLRAT
jgi:hypothetical protein